MPAQAQAATRSGTITASSARPGSVWITLGDAEHEALRAARTRRHQDAERHGEQRAGEQRSEREPRWAEQVAGQERELLAQARPPEQRVERAGPGGAACRGAARTSVVGGRAEQLRGRPDLHEPARVQHGDPIAEQQRLGHVVGHEDRGEAELAADAPERLLQAVAGERIERAERLVEQHEPRRAASARATPTRCCWPPESVVGTAVAERRRRARPAPAARRRARDAFRVPAEQARRHGDVLADRQVREQPDLLEHVADARGAARCGLEVARVARRRPARGRRSGSISRLTILSVVVLPEPEPPTSTSSSPRSTRNETSSTATLPA